jgi:hypothetical protein
MLGDGYPFEGPERLSFWSNHFALIHEGPLVLLVLNSSAAHTNIEDAKRGGIDETTLERLSRSLEEFDKVSGHDLLRVALCHHHPHQHSGIGLADTELMLYGDRLLSLLELHHFGLIIHGHKHHPSLESAAGGASPPIVFAAGSFSANISSDLSTDLATKARNLFHIIDLVRRNDSLCGTIQSWQFHFMGGWTPAHESAADFPPRSGFGFRGSQEQLARRILENIKEYGTSWDELASVVAEINYLTPRDFASIERLVKMQNVEIYRDKDGLPKAFAKTPR